MTKQVLNYYKDHPRIRGEHRDEAGEGSVGPGSSPHTRGAHRNISGCHERSRIIPAYAGSTQDPTEPSQENMDHPRIRGEHIDLRAAEDTTKGSSPHTRGAPCSLATPSTTRGIIPAYAGSTCRRWSAPGWRWDHPRIRGEHLDDLVVVGDGVGSSPHTRGARLEIPAIPRIAAVIIPVFLYPSPTPQEEADRSMVLLTLS